MYFFTEVASCSPLRTVFDDLENKERERELHNLPRKVKVEDHTEETTQLDQIEQNADKESEVENNLERQVKNIENHIEQRKQIDHKQEDCCALNIM